MRIRKNVKSLSSVEKTNFVNAVLALKQKPGTLHPSDTSMTRYDDFVETHMNAMNTQSHTDPRTDPKLAPRLGSSRTSFFSNAS